MSFHLQLLPDDKCIYDDELGQNLSTTSMDSLLLIKLSCFAAIEIEVAMDFLHLRFFTHSFSTQSLSSLQLLYAEMKEFTRNDYFYCIYAMQC